MINRGRGAVNRSPVVPGGSAHTQAGLLTCMHTHALFLPLAPAVTLFSPSLTCPNTQTGPKPQAGAGIQLLSLLQSNSLKDTTHKERGEQAERTQLVSTFPGLAVVSKET